MVKLKAQLEKLTPALLVAVIILAFAVGVMWQKINALESAGTTKVANQPSATNQPTRPTTGKMTEADAKKIPEISDSDFIRGGSNPEIYLIEYSDFECPFCKRFHPTAQQAMDEYGDKIAWVYRHFPLDQLHKQARREAEASECVASLGGEDAFWKFTDLIYETTTSNDGLDLEKMGDYAAQVGVNKSAFQNCWDEGEFKEAVNADYDGGINAGITGTPGNFIMNNKGEAWRIPGAVPYATLKQIIDEALASN